ncbi:hypothetical protein B0H14DRAFT_2364026 [Mycena olivaceomarginata]|nr:hypothetical protein B0H14DRAFT_2364026 [Mycena olivaceomarginata]
MVIGGRTQYLTRVQGMPKDIEDTLIKAEHIFLWLGKRARFGHETMILDTTEGGKQILDIRARNEAIDLWNLQSYLVQGPKRAPWYYFVDYILRTFLEKSYLNVRPGQILNVFLQDVHIPISSKTPLPEDIKRMILAARKYNLKFTGLSITQDVKLKMPIWKHPTTYGARSLSHRYFCTRIDLGQKKIGFFIPLVEMLL